MKAKGFQSLGSYPWELSEPPLLRVGVQHRMPTLRSMQPESPHIGVNLIAVLIGNTTIHVARAQGDEIHDHAGLPISKIDKAVDAIVRFESAPIVIASVNEPVSHELINRLIGDDRVVGEIHRIGQDIHTSIASSLSASAGTGQDRLLAAAGAFDLLGQACVVVDAGTAVTIDFVDGDGVFQGGAIIPGLAMSLGALHEGASALPMVTPAKPDDAEPFGKDTKQAMLNGAMYGVRGAVRALTERYAERYGAYPLVVATGGDAEFLFAEDDLIDRVVPDLALRGIAIAFRTALAGDEAPDLSRPELSRPELSR